MASHGAVRMASRSSNPMRLNIGSGRNLVGGFVNVDRFRYPGLTIADVERGLPFRDETFDRVLASHMLEHVERFDRAWREIHRVLRVGGQLEVRVPYGPDSNPWHLRHFDEESVKLLLDPGHNLEGGRWWRLVEMRVTARGWPWWHLRKYVKRDLPIGAKKELTFVLERVE